MAAESEAPTVRAMAFIDVATPVSPASTSRITKAGNRAVGQAGCRR